MLTERAQIIQSLEFFSMTGLCYSKRDCPLSPEIELPLPSVKLVTPNRAFPDDGAHDDIYARLIDATSNIEMFIFVSIQSFHFDRADSFTDRTQWRAFTAQPICPDDRRRFTRRMLASNFRFQSIAQLPGTQEIGSAFDHLEQHRSIGARHAPFGHSAFGALVGPDNLCRASSFSSPRRYALTSHVRESRRLFISVLQSHQRHIIFNIIRINRSLDRIISGCAMPIREKSRPIARIAGPLIIGCAAIRVVANGLGKRRRPSRRKLQKRTDKDRLPRRTGREREPNLPEAILKAPGGPIAALLHGPQGAGGGRSFAENYAELIQDQAPCLALARADRIDGIRVKLPESEAAAIMPPRKPVLH